MRKKLSKINSKRPRGSGTNYTEVDRSGAGRNGPRHHASRLLSRLSRHSQGEKCSYDIIN